MRAFILAAAAAVAVVLAAPAHAQRADDSQPTKTPIQLIDEQKQRDAAEIERQYERRAKRPDSDAKSDPWRNMRAADTPQQKPR